MNSTKITEQQNLNSKNIDSMDVGQILETINNEDAIVAKAVKTAIPQIQLFVESLVESFRKGGRLFYVGAGTSGRLGVLDASECPPTYRTNPEMVQGIIAGGDKALKNSVEGAEDSGENGTNSIIEKKVNENDTVLGISANGNAPFIHGALEEAKARGATTGLLMCNSPMEKKYIDHVISVIVGPEIITGSTRMKAGTATKLVLNMITTTSMIKLNKTYGNLMVDLTACNDKLWDRGTRIVSQITHLDYEDSLHLLNKADGEVKTAIVMESNKCSKGEAKNKLDVVNGSLSQVLGEKKN
ncbi:MAG: N-acetylmuramic acid 6-phosphate etherase [Candidatus Marinimicrobia bacterium]|nr:N-acetylmuramic acid 6-phosphate etherase [Candidatus Neomarinimicrobiota bacterium]